MDGSFPSTSHQPLAPPQPLAQAPSDPKQKLQSSPLTALLNSSLQGQFSLNLLKNAQNKATPVLESIPPRLNIVIMIIGSRGDIQPFVALAKVLVGEWGHRVRVATHPEFREFVEEEFKNMGEDIAAEESKEDEIGEGEDKKDKKPRIKGGKGEFFSVGGDPLELMEFMVKNPGLLPSLETIKAGDVARRREQMGIMFEGFWRSCVEPSKYILEEENGNCGRNIDTSHYHHHHHDSNPNTHQRKRKQKKHTALITRSPTTTPFIADVIIANPPSFAHIHCAEKLGIPLHLMFTFPYTPTATIPHPLANISQSNVDSGYTNLISYSMVEMMTWQGLGDFVNRFRKETLGLEPISTLWAPGLLARLKTPTTYLWSPSLIPKPQDWGPEVDIAGFVFLGKASSFSPPPELQEFLDKEPDNPPIYIGFGSIVVDDPDSLTQLIFQAVQETGVRALVAEGWGGLGGEESKPDSVFMLDNTPHDWLFPRCRAVIHHGGAGTTAIGLKCGKPTYIVSFFGDQPFWGTMVKNAGAGDWAPFKDLDKDRLVGGIKIVISPETAEQAGDMAKKIEEEGDGAKNAVMSLYRQLETVGVTSHVGKRGRKRKKRKERRPGEMEGHVGTENTIAGVVAKESRGGGGDVFGMEEGKRKDAGKARSLFSGVKFSQKSKTSKKSTLAATTSAGGGRGTSGDNYKSSLAESDSGPDEPDDSRELVQDAGIRCSLLPETVAVWRVRRTRIKISAVAAYILVHEGKFTWKDLRLVRHTEWNDFDGPGDPLSGGAGAIVTALGGVAKGFFGVPYTWYKGVKRIEEDIEAKGWKGGKGELAEVELGENCNALRERKGDGAGEGSDDKSTNRQATEPSSTQNGTAKKQNSQKKKPQVDPNLQEGEDEDDVADNKDPISTDVIHGTTHSVVRILRTSLRLPMDISLALAQGFHNAPRLYGDTVRRPNRITGIHSGLRAAGKEILLGTYDSTTGLVLKPYHGAKHHGPAGFASGVGKALGGIFFSLGAGVAGSIGYTLKGVHKELHKSAERAVVSAIRDMRIWQGTLEARELTNSGARDEVVQRVLAGWETEEKREFEKIQDEAGLKRAISGLREIGWGAPKLRQLRKRAERRRKKRLRELGRSGVDEAGDGGEEEGGGVGGKRCRTSDKGKNRI